jgi:hypothetical protein
MSSPTDGRVIFKGLVNNTSQTFDGMPEGKTVLLQATGGSVTVAFYDDDAASYGSGELIDAPGAKIDCPHEKVQFTTTASVRLRIVPFKG